jgi:hypothetical protein
MVGGENQMQRGPQRRFGCKGLFRKHSKQSELGKSRLCQRFELMEAIFQPSGSVSVQTFADCV